MQLAGPIRREVILFTVISKYWIGSRVMQQSEDNRATQFLFQKVAIDVQCGNAESAMAMIPSRQVWA